MSIEVKVTQVGSSLGVVLPKYVLERLKVGKGDQLHVVERFRFDPKTRQLRREYTARDPRFLTEPVTGSNAMDISGVPYDAEPCEDLTIDENAKLGPRR